MNKLVILEVFLGLGGRKGDGGRLVDVTKKKSFSMWNLRKRTKHMMKGEPFEDDKGDSGKSLRVCFWIIIIKKHARQ